MGHTMNRDGSAHRDSDRHLGQVVHERYKLEREIGCGTRSVAYEASDQTGGPDVAIKIQRSELRADGVVRGSLRREAMVHAGLDYSHVPTIITQGTTADSSQYLVMSLCPGVTVGEALAIRRAPFGVETALWILTDVCLGLRSAHGHGIVHGAVSPRSVILTTRRDVSPAVEKAYLFNFGHAMIVDPRYYLTRFVAPGPEVARRPPLVAPHYYPCAYAGALEASYLSDLRAAGCLFMEMLTGHRLPDPSVSAKHMSLLASQAIPEEILRLCERATSQSATEWFETTEDLFSAAMTCLASMRSTQNLTLFPGYATLRFIHSLERPQTLGWRGPSAQN